MKMVGGLRVYLCRTGSPFAPNQAELSQKRDIVHSLCAFQPQPKVSVSQQQIAGPAKMAGIATIQKCIGPFYSYGGT